LGERRKDGMSVCIIHHPLCEPSTCIACHQAFCGHDESKHPTGYYHEYCSQECHDAKKEQLWALAEQRFKECCAVLIVEHSYCFLLPSTKGQYGFKILSGHAKSLEDSMAVDYQYFDKFSTEKRVLCAYRMTPKLEIAFTIYQEKYRSMWTICGFRLLDGEIDTYGVGGNIDVIDLRKKVREAS